MALTIVITGTEEDELTYKAAKSLKEANRIILHTGVCGCADWLSKNGIKYETLDELYEQFEDFDAHTQAAADRVAEAAANEEVCYCILTDEDRSAAELLKRQRSTTVVGSREQRLKLYSGGAALTINAYDAIEARLSPLTDVIVTEITSRTLAGDLKLNLMKSFPFDSQLYFIKPDGSTAFCTLKELDRLKDYDHKCCCLVKKCGDLKRLESYTMDELLLLNENDKLMEPDVDSAAGKLADMIECLSTCDNDLKEEICYEAAQILNEKSNLI